MDSLGLEVVSEYVAHCACLRPLPRNTNYLNWTSNTDTLPSSRLHPTCLFPRISRLIKPVGDRFDYLPRCTARQ